MINKERFLKFSLCDARAEIWIKISAPCTVAHPEISPQEPKRVPLLVPSPDTKRGLVVACRYTVDKIN